MSSINPGKQNYLKLNEIFPKIKNRFSEKGNYYSLEIEQEIAEQIARKLNLRYQVENFQGSSNVCFEDNKDVRVEYKTTFDKADLIDYVLSHLTDLRRFDSFIKDDLAIPFPEDTDHFWVKVGSYRDKK